MGGPHQQVTSFWAALSERDREELRRVSQRRFFEADSILLNQDEHSNYVLVIMNGCVKVVAVTEDGYHAVLAIRDAGDLLGELASADGGPRSATLHALTEVEALLTSAARFELFRRGRPSVDRAVQALLSARLRESDRSLATIGAGTAVQRLAHTLVSLGHRYGTPDGDGIRIDLPLSQDDLAGLTFTSLRTVGRILADWRAAGWISTGRRNVLLLNPAALDALRST